MSTTFTSGLRLTNQPTGGNANTWGTIADFNFEFIDDAITGILDVDVTGASSTTLSIGNGTPDEARNALLKITGTPISANSIIIPESEKIYAVDAQHTSVAGGITVRTNSGSGVNFVNGQRGFVYCDGVSVIELNPTVSALDPSENLGDVENVATSRTNLGLTDDFSTKNLGNLLETSGSTVGVNTSALFEVIWPIGSFYSNRTDGTNPGTLMGFGTWTSAGVGRVAVGVGTGVDENGVSVVFTAETCGGEYEHVMTTAELVNHGHDITLTSRVGDDPGGSGATGWGGDNISKGNRTVSACAVGNSQPFNVQQPWYSVYQWVRTA